MGSQDEKENLDDVRGEELGKAMKTMAIRDIMPREEDDCKTPDFHRKPESLYHRDSPWISGYRVQNVSQIDTQSHTSHHIKLIVHEIITSPLWSTSIQASWLNRSENFYATVAIFSEGSPSLFFPPQANSSEVTYPSVVPSVGVAVELGLIPCTPKVYPQGVG
jgi:hypothetical protein